MNTAELRRHKLSNTLQSLLLAATLALILGVLARLLWGTGLAVAAVALSAGIYVANARISPVLVMRMYRARPLPPEAAPRLHLVLAELAGRAGLPRVPALYYLPSDVMNAFTVGGTGNAAIAVSDGLLRRLDLREVAAVLAHEVSHIRHHDIRIMSFADLTSRLTNLLSMCGQLLLVVNFPLMLAGLVTVSWWAILLLITAPTVSALVQLALSRTREFNADLGAAELTGDPQALASALTKMSHLEGGRWWRVLYPGYQKLPEASLLRTHPPTAERVRRLLAIRDRRPDGRPWEPWQMPVADSHRPLRAVAPSPFRPQWHRSGLWF